MNKILKAARGVKEEQLNKRHKDKNDSRLFIRNNARKQWDNILKVLREKQMTVNLKFNTQQSSFFKRKAKHVFRHLIAEVILRQQAQPTGNVEVLERGQ